MNDFADGQSGTLIHIEHLRPEDDDSPLILKAYEPFADVFFISDNDLFREYKDGAIVPNGIVAYYDESHSAPNPYLYPVIFGNKR